MFVGLKNLLPVISSPTSSPVSCCPTKRNIRKIHFLVPNQENKRDVQAHLWRTHVQKHQSVWIKAEGPVWSITAKARSVSTQSNSFRVTKSAASQCLMLILRASFLQTHISAAIMVVTARSLRERQPSCSPLSPLSRLKT